MGTKIWWDKSWNPITGCSAISAGCKNCYAKALIGRFGKMWGYDFTPTFHPDRLGIPATWKTPQRIFVCSMSDLFHDENLKVIYSPGDTAAETVIRQIAFYKDLNHHWLLLTKRPENMFKVFNCYGASEIKRTIPNLQLGVTVESQDNLWRVEELLKLRAYASKLFVSVEPMLGPVDFLTTLRGWRYQAGKQDTETFREHNYLSGAVHTCQRKGKKDWEKMEIGCADSIDGVICGEETGPGKRQFKEEWAIDLMAQCKAAGIPFFYKGGALAGNTYEEVPK